MADLLTREQFEELLKGIALDWEDKPHCDAVAAYSAALTQIDEMKEDALAHGRVVAAALSRATTAEKDAERLKRATEHALLSSVQSKFYQHKHELTMLVCPECLRQMQKELRS